MVALVELSLAVAALSVTFTTSHMGLWLQKWLVKKSILLGLLFSCPYCISHWFALGLVLIYLPGGPIDIIVTTFTIVGMAAVFSGMIRLLSKLNKG